MKPNQHHPFPDTMTRSRSCRLPLALGPIGFIIVFTLSSLVFAQSQPSEPYRHPRTGLVFPSVLGGLSGGRVTNFEEKKPGLGVSVGYGIPQVAVATIYVYDLGNPAVPSEVQSPVVINEFNRSVQEMIQAMRSGMYTSEKGSPEVKEVSAGPTTLGNRHESPEALSAMFAITQEQQTIHSWIYLTVYKQHFIKIRFTYPRTEKIAAEKALQEFLDTIGVMLIRDLLSQNQGKTWTVSIGMDPYFESQDTIKAAWLGYLMARVAYVSKHQADYPQLPGKIRPLFEEETEARTKLGQIWKEFKEQNKMLQDPYLDRLSEVIQTGFIREYVWNYCKQPFWTAENLPLRLSEFESWQKQNLSGHQLETHGSISFEAK